MAHLTHAHFISDFACVVYMAVVENLMNGIPKKPAAEVLHDPLRIDPPQLHHTVQCGQRQTAVVRPGTGRLVISPVSGHIGYFVSIPLPEFNRNP